MCNIGSVYKYIPYMYIYMYMCNSGSVYKYMYIHTCTREILVVHVKKTMYPLTTHTDMYTTTCTYIHVHVKYW